MRKLAVIAMGAALIATPVLAQPMSNPTMQGATPAPMAQPPMAQPMAPAPMTPPPAAMPMRDGHPMPPRHARPMRHGDRMDRQAMRGGRMAPEGDVNAAYMGGGVVLQGAPGAPAPMPQPTPPGQMPANMVPAR